MALPPGTKLGPYEILAAIGAGGMGEVYRARDPRIGREVAVKVIHSSFANDAERLARFEQEVRAAGALNHPNILSIHDVGTSEGTPYLVSELLEGETLRERLSASLPAKKAVDYAVQIAQGLASAHEKGIIHRDLKPENMFITRDGRVKILDFGLAKLTRPEAANGGRHSNISTTPGTESGVLLGTVGYMAPEQVRGLAADARSDIFAFGTVLYEMLTGDRAFKGATAADTMSAILKEDPPEITATGRTIPPGLERIVRHCMEKNPAERFQSARDIAFALDAVSGISSAGAQDTPTPLAPSKRKLALGTVAVLVAAGIALGLLIGTRFGQHGIGEVTFQPLNFRAETIFNARFAPDGRTIFYSAARTGVEPEIFTASPDYPEARSLGLKHATLLSVSSKGELALLTDARFVAHEFFIGTLARMPLGGGAPRQILEGVREADWSPDGSDLAIIREVAGMDRLEYPPGKVLGQTAGYFSDFRISPDGQHIALFEHAMRYDDRGCVITFDLRGNKTTLTDVWWGEEGLAWSAGGREVLFSAGDSYATFPVHAVSLAGVKRRALSTQGGIQIRDVSGDGRWLATREDMRMDLFAIAPGEKAERNLTWLDGSYARDISADGRFLLFDEENSVLGPNYSVCLRRTDGSPPVRLGEGRACSLSPDGKLALAFIPTSPGQLVLYPTGPGEARRLERGPLTAYDSAFWFSDGKRILISGSELGHAPRCYIQEIAGGAPRAVTPGGTNHGRISPDGSLAIVSNGSGQKLIVPMAGGEPRVLPFLTADDDVVRWTPDGRSLLVHSDRQVPSPLERVDISTGRRETLRTLAPPDLAGVLSIGPVVVADDLTTYAYSALPQRSSLFLVEGAR